MVEDVDVVVVDGAVAEDVDVVVVLEVVVMGVLTTDVFLGLAWTSVGNIMDLRFRLLLNVRCRRIVSFYQIE